MSFVVSGFIGIAGSLLLSLCCLVLSFYYLTDFEIDKYFTSIQDKIHNGFFKLKDKTADAISNKIAEVKAKKENEPEIENEDENENKVESTEIQNEKVDTESNDEIKNQEIHNDQKTELINDNQSDNQIIKNEQQTHEVNFQSNIPKFVPGKLNINRQSHQIVSSFQEDKITTKNPFESNVEFVLENNSTNPNIDIDNIDIDNIDTAPELETYIEPPIEPTFENMLTNVVVNDNIEETNLVNSIDYEDYGTIEDIPYQTEENVIYNNYEEDYEYKLEENEKLDENIPIELIDEESKENIDIIHTAPQTIANFNSINLATHRLMNVPNTNEPSGQIPNQNNDHKKLVVVVNEIEQEPAGPMNPLSTDIHDEEIVYTAPSLELLNNESRINQVNDEELKMNAQILQEKLETFKIFIENLSVTPGPVVTQYEFVPAAGIKISRIESLADDLAMALKAKGIRIIAPIPGKGTVGIEIPNQNPSLVRFSSLVNSSKFSNDESYLPLGLGKSISGEVELADLAKMPHLLIAGSTGSGKSVGVNTIIASLLYKKHPSELKFVIIDPKKVELQQYSRLKNHFLATSPDVRDLIITNPSDAVSILKSTVLEMENRYDILSKVGQRNIADYNKKVKEGTIKSNDKLAHKAMPYIVVIIDELADLMLTASKEIEEPIIRLAQMARAVGIHLVLATQRPSVDVITGIIKANFPARMAYLVASKIDSRTILDTSGAEQLLGNGDMLFLPPGRPKPERIQNSYISTDEVEAICDFIGNQRGYSAPYQLPSINEGKGENGMLSPDERDPLFEDAARLIIRHQQGSVSLIQRRLKVGYARAGRIMDELEATGIVGPADGSKTRLVLYDSESDLEHIL